jgi:hypothetical protein
MILISGILSMWLTAVYLVYWADHVGYIFGYILAVFLPPIVYYCLFELSLRCAVWSFSGNHGLPKERQDWFWRIIAILIAYIPVGILIYGLMYGEIYIPPVTSGQ